MKCPRQDIRGYEECGHKGCYDAGYRKGRSDALKEALEAVCHLKGYRGEAKRLLIQKLG